MAACSIVIFGSVPELFLKLYTVRGDRRVIERLQLFSRVIYEMNKKIVHEFLCKNVAKRD